MAWRIGLLSSKWRTLPHRTGAPATDYHECRQHGSCLLGSMYGVGGLLGVCWRVRSCPAFTHDPSGFNSYHSLLTPLSIVLMSFFGLYQKEEGGNLKVERKVGMKPIRMGDSNSKHRLFREAVFISQWQIALSGMFRDEVSWNPQTSLLFR